MEGPRAELEKQLVAIYLIAHDERGGADKAPFVVAAQRARGGKPAVREPAMRSSGNGTSRSRPISARTAGGERAAGPRRSPASTRGRSTQTTAMRRCRWPSAWSPTSSGIRRTYRGVTRDRLQSCADGSPSASRKGAAADVLAVHAPGRAAEQGRMMRFLVFCLKYGFKSIIIRKRSVAANHPLLLDWSKGQSKNTMSICWRVSSLLATLLTVWAIYLV